MERATVRLGRMSGALERLWEARATGVLRFQATGGMVVVREGYLELVAYGGEASWDLPDPSSLEAWWQGALKASQLFQELLWDALLQPRERVSLEPRGDPAPQVPGAGIALHRDNLDLFRRVLLERMGLGDPSFQEAPGGDDWGDWSF